METRVLVVSASPIKGGSVDDFTEKIVRFFSAKPEVKTETVNLGQLDIGDCCHCNWCNKKQAEDKYCAMEDDAQPLFKLVEAAHILVLATPVYFMRTSGRMAVFIDRLRHFMWGNITRGRLRNKIGVSAAVSWVRHGGVETTHLTHIMAFLALEMIPVSSHFSASLLGAGAVSSPGGSGVWNPPHIGIEEDEIGLQTIKPIMSRALDLARIMKNSQGRTR